MTTLKKTLSVVLALILIFTFTAITPITAFAGDEETTEYSPEEIALNKKVEDGFVYVRTRDGSSAVLVGYEGTETEIDIPSSINNLKIVSIADDAFSGNTTIKKVSAGTDVLELGDRAFKGCTSLTEVDGFSALTSIGISVFEGCSSLTEIKIPDNVVEIPEKAFKDCTNLGEVDYHKNLKGVAKDAFSGTALEKNQPDGPLSLGRILYSYKGNVTNLVIPEGVSIVEDYAFLGETSIKTVEFGPDVEEIGLYAFQNCINLEKIICGDAVSIIRAGAFKGCSALKELDFSETTISTIGYESFSGCTSLSNVKFADTLIEISAKAFKDTAFKTIDLAKNVNTIGEKAFEGNKNLESINVTEKNKEYSSKDGVLYNKNGNDLIIFPVAKTGSFEVPENVKVIKEYAFLNASISSIKFTLPEPKDEDDIPEVALEYIGNNAFEGSKITEITLPDKVTVINSEVFKNAENLAKVNFGPNVTYIGNAAFLGTKSLTDISIPDKVKDISADAFKNTGLKTVNVGNGVVRINSGAFADNKYLKDVVLGDLVEKLGENAFQNCVALKKINLPAAVNSFTADAFAGCKSLKKITVSNDSQNYKVTGGAIYTADGKTLVMVADGNLKELKLSNGVEVISAGAFNLAQGISEITFVDSLVNVKGYALDVTNWFKAQNGVVYAGKTLYKVKGNVADVKVNDGILTISDGALSNKAVTSVTLPKTLKLIGADAFKGSSISQIVIPNAVTSIGNNAFAGVKTLKKVTLSNTLETMGNAIFKDCTALKNIVIPATVKTIPVDAFANCTSLVKVNFGSVETISKYAFKGCESLIIAELPATLTAIDPLSFVECKILEAVNVADGNANLKSVEGVVIAKDEDGNFNTLALYPAGRKGAYTIADDIAHIADRAFYDCDNLTTVTFPDGISSIGAEAFFDCDAILSVVLPEAARRIGDYAFASCNELREFVVNTNLTEYPENTFDGCYYFNYDSVTINVKESSAILFIVIILVFVVIGLVWSKRYKKKQVVLEQEIKAKIAERELLEMADKIKAEQAEKAEK